MRNVYQLEKGQLTMSISHIHTDDGLVKEILAKLVAIAATCLLIKGVYTEFVKYQETAELSKLVTVLFLGICLLFLIGILYYAFSLRDWRKKIHIIDIKKIIVDLDERNEVDVKVSFQNNKSKAFTFRKLEKEYERFLHDIQKKSNCAISYKTN